MRTPAYLSLVLLCLVAAITPAQSVDAFLRGRVEDPSGAAVAAAQVTVTETASGYSRTTLTNKTGSWAAPALPPGEYEIEVRAEGFKVLRETGVVLRLGERARRDLALEVGEFTDAIEVSAETSLIETQSVALGVVIPNNYIVNLPLNGRNFLELSLLAPGTVNAAEGSAGSERGRFAFNAAGAREDANSYVYDGVYAIDPVINSFTLTPPVDAVHEFRIQTSNSEAGMGRNSGGQISVALKQGGNAFHGSVYEFFRNDSLDARNFFDLPDGPAPKLRRNQFGFAVGGPLRRDSTFFFADFEGLRERRAVTRTTNVPTAAERQGDFSNSVLPRPVAFDPSSGQFFPFPNDQLPFLHPTGAAVANLYPLPNRNVPGQNYVAAPGGSADGNKFDVRIDQRLGERGLLSGRYSFSDLDRFDPYGAQGFSEVPGYGNNGFERGQNVMVGETHSFGSSWVNEIRFGYNRVGGSTFHENSGTSINQLVGLPDFSSRGRDLGLSFIEVTGLSPLGGEFNNPQDSTVDSYQISDTVSVTQGDHLVQFGFERRAIRGNAFRDVQARGQISFTNFAATQSALADLLLGFPSFTSGADSEALQNQRAGAWNFFVHDSWRVRPDLTLTLGLRYEYNTPPFDAFDAASVFDPLSGQIVQVGTAGVPRGGYAPDKNNFGPRVGLAWSPGGSRNTVIRAGYAIVHNFPALAPGIGIYFNPPQFNFQLFFPSRQAPITIDNPWPAGQQAPLPPSVVAYDPATQTSYAQQWNFTVQREVSSELVLSVGYNGTRGVHLLGARDINQPAASPMMPNLRPLPFFSDINQIESASSSIYHSLQWQLQCRFREGLTGLFGYTWSQSIDNASGFFSSRGDANYPQNSYDIGAERGRSSFNAPHRFVGSFAYDLPVGAGRRLAGSAAGLAGTLISGWSINSIITLQAGQPFTVALPGELDNSNTGRSIFGFGAGDRPNLVGDPQLANPDPARWFDAGAFAMPPFGSFGNAGRNVVVGPALRNIDFSLLKDTRLGESATLQFRAEIFNLFNTPNFNQPNNFFGTPGFGRTLSARDGREIQFGVKLLF